MLIFAHVFCGALIGLVFWHLTKNSWALPICILGTFIPDLVDKCLAFLFPGILGSGRTICHSLILVAIIFVAGILLWYYRHTLLGIAFACAAFSHQILDAMWTVPSTWFYPLLGPFPTFMIPGYVGHYFWLELSTLSEWLFAGATLVIFAAWYIDSTKCSIPFLNAKREKYARFGLAFLLGVMGILLLFFELVSLPDTVFAPPYDSITKTMTGIIALGGACILLKWKRFPSPEEV